MINLERAFNYTLSFFDEFGECDIALITVVYHTMAQDKRNKPIYAGYFNDMYQVKRGTIRGRFHKLFALGYIKEQKSSDSKVRFFRPTEKLYGFAKRLEAL